MDRDLSPALEGTVCLRRSLRLELALMFGLEVFQLLLVFLLVLEQAFMGRLKVLEGFRTRVDLRVEGYGLE